MIKHIARSEYASADRLRYAAAILERQFAKKPPSRYLRLGGKPLGILIYADRKEAAFDDTTHFRTYRLPDISCFDIRRSLGVAEIEVDTESKSIAESASWLDWLRQHEAGLQASFLFVDAVRSEREVIQTGSHSADEWPVSFGIQAEVNGDVEVYWSLEGRKSQQPTACRKFLEECIAVADLGRDILFEETEKGFRVVSNTHQVRVGDAKYGGYDPSGIKIVAPSLAIAWDWHRRVVAGAQISAKGFGIHMKCDAEFYQRYREQWNSMAADWEIAIEGGYKPDVDPFDGFWAGGGLRISFPLLQWEVGEGESYYQCDAVWTRDGGRLEMLTNLTASKNMMDRITNAGCGLAFHLVDAPE